MCQGKCIGSYNEPWTHSVDFQVSPVPLHLRTNIGHLHDYTEHVCKENKVFNRTIPTEHAIICVDKTTLHLKRPSSEHWGTCSRSCAALTALSCSHWLKVSVSSWYSDDEKQENGFLHPYKLKREHVKHRRLILWMQIKLCLRSTIRVFENRLTYVSYIQRPRMFLPEILPCVRQRMPSSEVVKQRSFICFIFCIFSSMPEVS